MQAIPDPTDAAGYSAGALATVGLHDALAAVTGLPIERWKSSLPRLRGRPAARRSSHRRIVRRTVDLFAAIGMAGWPFLAPHPPGHAA